MRLVSLLALAFTLGSTTALAQAGPAAGQVAGAQDGDHHDHDDEIVVTGVGSQVSQGGVSQAHPSF